MPDQPTITSRTVPLRPPSPLPLLTTQPSSPPEAAPPGRPAGPYPLPATTSDAMQAWGAIRSGDAPPDPHRAYLKHLVEQALDSGLFYSVEVRARVIEQLGDLLDEEMRARNPGRVRTEGGVIGMEIYLAREQLRHEAQQREAALAHGRVQPRVGLRLGTLIWHDQKRTLACEITHIDGLSVTLTGRRGRREVSVTADARYIEDAAERTRQHAAAKTAARP